jgi:polygalacturonase
MKAILTILLALASTLLVSAQEAIKDISWYVTHCPFPTQTPILPTFPDKDFSITDFGAIPDGHTLNTEAFRKAIQACSAAGGGRVTVPSGKWLTGPVELLSHVNLYLAADAVVQFTADHTQYPMIATKNGPHRHLSTLRRRR